MNCTALSNSSVSIRKSSPCEIVDAQEQIKIAKFLKYLLRSRLWFIRSKDEEHASLMQSLYCSRNQSQLTELEYTKAVQDFQVYGVMKNLIRSQLAIVAFNSDILWKTIVKGDLNLREAFNVDINYYFEALRKDSLVLQNVIDETAAIERRKDNLRWEICKVTTDTKSTAKDAEDFGTDQVKAKKFKKLSSRIGQMRKMQFIMSNLIASSHLEDEKFDECYELLEDIGRPRSWHYYRQLTMSGNT